MPPDRFDDVLIAIARHEAANAARNAQIAHRLGELDDRIDELKNETTGAIATLSERSKQHEKRMDRTDQRSGVFGAVAGAVVSGAGFLAGKVFGI